MLKNIVKKPGPSQIVTRKYQNAIATKMSSNDNGRYREEKLSLPHNIDPNESNRFSTQRSRELNSSSMLAHHSNFIGGKQHLDITLDNSSKAADPHVKFYDSHNAVSLNAVMQSNVPQPFGGLHNYAIAPAMPGGSVMSLDKYQAGYMQGTHYTTLRQEFRRNWHPSSGDSGKIYGLLQCMTMQLQPTSIRRNFSSQAKEQVKSNDEQKGTAAAAEKSQESQDDTKPLSKRDQLKRAVKEYGSTVIIFHIGISLASLGGFYLLVSSGLDVAALMDKFGVSADVSGKVMQGASTFVVAYAIHKMFAPVRISITLFSTPFIVRYLRLKGILKPPKK